MKCERLFVFFIRDAYLWASFRWLYRLIFAGWSNISDGVKDCSPLLRAGIVYTLQVGSINSIFYFLHKTAEPFNCLEQDNLA